MKKIMMTIALAATLLGLSLNSQAMPIPVIEGPQLIGAKHVKVGWKFFDVEFIDGSCTSLFDGCDSNNDFAFNTLPSAQQALQALLDTVLIGRVDLEPFRVRGCDHPVVCNIITPFNLTSIQSNNSPIPMLAVLAAGVINFNPSLSNDIDTVLPTAGLGFRSDSTANSPSSQITTFARFSQVPEPSSLALFALAFAALGFARRKAFK